eukprot:SAG25_NODE_2359_length_1682_cov_1.379659_2_plen_245_part_00
MGAAGCAAMGDYADSTRAAAPCIATIRESPEESSESLVPAAAHAAAAAGGGGRRRRQSLSATAGNRWRPGAGRRNPRARGRGRGSLPVATVVERAGCARPAFPKEGLLILSDGAVSFDNVTSAHAKETVAVCYVGGQGDSQIKQQCKFIETWRWVRETMGDFSARTHSTTHTHTHTHTHRVTWDQQQAVAVAGAAPATAVAMHCTRPRRPHRRRRRRCSRLIAQAQAQATCSVVSSSYTTCLTV